jgi:hypothetical protein
LLSSPIYRLLNVIIELERAVKKTEDDLSTAATAPWGVQRT